jgi:hypothetical protein
MEAPRLLLDPEKTAEYLAVTVATLAKWRVNGGGPPFLKLGSRVRYDQKDIDRWIDGRRYRVTGSLADAADTHP